MKFTEGTGTESRRKEETDNKESLTLCHYKAINQVSISRRVICEVKGFVIEPVGEQISPGCSTAGLLRAFDSVAHKNLNWWQSILLH